MIPVTAAGQGPWPSMPPSLLPAEPGTRVGGRDRARRPASRRTSEPSSGSCWASTFAYGELASDLLTHMNGRVYDYRLGRFLSVDPVISNPANSQSINPYSYIGNNPLSGTDPTGYQSRSICEGTGAACNCSINGLDSQAMRNMINDSAAKGGGRGGLGGSVNSGADGARTKQHGADPTNAGSTTEVNRQPGVGGADAGRGSGRALQLDRDFRYIPAAPGSDFAWEPVLKAPGTPRDSTGPNWYSDVSGRLALLGALTSIAGEGLKGYKWGSNGKLYAPTLTRPAWTGGSPARVITRSIGPAIGGLGIAVTGWSIASDYMAMQEYDRNPEGPDAISPAHFAVNTSVNVYGVLGGGAAAPLVVPYFLVDGFYPGGWPAALEERSRLQDANRAILGPNWNIDRMEGGARY